jgi:hypothetical protein
MRRKTEDRLWSLTPAVIALLGVMVGAMLAGGFDYLRDIRRDGQDSRQASRLVAIEVSRIATELSVAVQDKTSPDPTRLPTSTFEAKAEVLAKYLSDDDWTALEIFYEQIEDIRELAALREQNRALNNLDPVVPMDKQTARDSRLLVGFADEIRARLGAEYFFLEKNMNEELKAAR